MKCDNEAYGNASMGMMALSVVCFNLSPNWKLNGACSNVLNYYEVTDL